MEQSANKKIKNLATDLQNKLREQKMLDEMIKCLNDEIDMYTKYYSLLCNGAQPLPHAGVATTSSGVINLVKNQNVSLTKAAPNLIHPRIGLGWDVRPGPGEQFDLDTSIFLLNANGKVRMSQDFIYYDNQRSADGSVYHHGDNQTGAGEGDDEQISVDLAKLPYDVQQILVICSIHEAEKRKQNFGMVQRAYIRIVDEDTNHELVRYDLSEDAHQWNTMSFGKLYRKDGEWKFKALGRGIYGGLPVLSLELGHKYEPKNQPTNQPDNAAAASWTPADYTSSQLQRLTIDDNARTVLAFLRPIMGAQFDDPVLLKNKVESLLNLARSYLHDTISRRGHLEVAIKQANYLVEQASALDIDDVMDLIQAFSLTDEEEKQSTSSAFTMYKNSSRVIRDKHDLHPGMHVFCPRFGVITHHGVCVQDPENGLIIVHLNGGAQTTGNWVKSQLAESVRLKNKLPSSKVMDSSVMKDGSSVAYVQPVTVEEFSAGDKIHCATYKYEAPYELMVARAYKAIWSGNYNLMTRNCEHFATYCKTGCGVSLQVDNMASKFASVSNFLDNMGTKLETKNTHNALLKMPSSVLKRVSGFTDKQAKKLSQKDFVHF